MGKDKISKIKGGVIELRGIIAKAVLIQLHDYTGRPIRVAIYPFAKYIR